uniref:Uncharacterized protein n=1 Tax=Trichuris muris TaxID=70415 RepID=A0A5S6QSI3_TRIMR
MQKRNGPVRFPFSPFGRKPCPYEPTLGATPANLQNAAAASSALLPSSVGPVYACSTAHLAVPLKPYSAEERRDRPGRELLMLCKFFKFKIRTGRGVATPRPVRILNLKNLHIFSGHRASVIWSYCPLALRADALRTSACRLLGKDSRPTKGTGPSQRLVPRGSVKMAAWPNEEAAHLSFHLRPTLSACVAQHVKGLLKGFALSAAAVCKACLRSSTAGCERPRRQPWNAHLGDSEQIRELYQPRGPFSRPPTSPRRQPGGSDVAKKRHGALPAIRRVRFAIMSAQFSRGVEPVGAPWSALFGARQTGWPRGTALRLSTFADIHRASHHLGRLEGFSPKLSGKRGRRQSVSICAGTIKSPTGVAGKACTRPDVAPVVLPRAFSTKRSESCLRSAYKRWWKMTEPHRKELCPRQLRHLSVLLALLLCVGVGATPRRSLKRRGNGQSDLGSACRRNKCDPVYPINLSGTCVQSALSSREICYPDFYQLDYTCAARYGVNHRSLSPPTIANGQYQSLITKFRAGNGRPSQLKAYLVVQYQCNAGFGFLDEVEHLYCQKGKWIATPPVCVPSHLIAEYRIPGNPCLIDHAGCSHYCRYTTSPVAQTHCECPDGYLLDSNAKTCLEMKNPCDLDNGGCSHLCVDEGPGRAHRCRCPSGYTLISDGRTCEPIKSRTSDSGTLCKNLSYGYPDNSCRDECHMDEDCPIGSRCCWNGCSQVCYQPIEDLPVCNDAMGCQCSVLNVTHHQCRCSKKLCLMATVAPVVSISPGRRLQLQPESSINVTCTAEGFPTPSIMWYWDSYPITDSKDIVSPEPSKLVLLLKNISTSITLRCEAVNNLGMASSQLEIMVIGPGSPPTNVTTQIDGFKAQITWQEPEFSNGPIEKYELNYVDTDVVGEKPSRKWIIVETSEPKADLELLPATTYYAKIRAFNKFGPGPFTPIFYIVTESEEFAPKVKVRPDNQVHVPRGGRAELECAAVGNPPPTVAWYKNGKILEQPDDSNPTITLLQLRDVIQSTTYECQAENKLGKENVSVRIIVLGPGSPPQNIQYQLIDGVNVELQWEAPDIPNGEILGYTIHYTDSPNEDIGNWEFLFSAASQSIEVFDLKPHTSYTFGIRALNAFGPGPLSGRFIVNTTQPNSVPKVAVHPSELVMLPPGGSVNISCSSSGYPVPLLRWLEKGVEVKSFAKPPTTEGIEASRVLVIEQIYETTTFTCEAQNFEGVDSRNVHVRIAGPGNAPKNVKVEAVGSDVTIRWEPPTITNGDIKDYIIYLAEDKHEDEWTEYHTDGPHVELKLELEPNKLYAARIAACTEYGCGVKSDPFEVRTLHVGSSPIVEIVPDEEVYLVKPGSSYQITCTASAYPPPLLTWYRNNVKIKSWQMPPVGTQSEPLSFALTIGHVAETVILECEAVNEIGTAKRAITLQVLGPGSPPENLTYAVTGDSVELHWSEPTHKNGPIESYNLTYVAEDDLPNGTWTTISIPGDDDKFVLQNLQEDTAYRIKIAAVGPRGSGPFSEALLLKTSRAEVKPSISIDPPMQNYHLHWGERLKISCSASGNPQPLATWYLLGERVSDIGPEVTLDEEVYESGEYECTALNKLGTASTKIAVTVEDDHQLPADITAEVKGTSVELKWEKPETENIVSFVIYYSNNTDGHENVYHLVVPVEDPKRARYSVLLDNLRPVTNYSIRLQALFDIGPGPMSDDMKVTTGETAWYITCNMEPKSPIDVPYGAAVDVTCIGSGEPAPMVTVRRNGNKIEGLVGKRIEFRLDDIHEPVYIECLVQNEVGRAKDTLSLFPTTELTNQTRPVLEIIEDGVQISWPSLTTLAVPGTTYEAYVNEEGDAPLDNWFKLPVNPETRSVLLDNFPTGRRLFARLKVHPFAKSSVLWTPISELTLPQPLKDVTLRLDNGRFKLRIGDLTLPDDMIVHVAITDNATKPLDQWLTFPLSKDPKDGSAVSSVDVEFGRKYYLRIVALKAGHPKKLLSLVHSVTAPMLDLCQQSQCEHTCKTIARGSLSTSHDVQCQCFSGYELAGDGRSCVPIMSASTWLHRNKNHRRFCSLPAGNSFCPGTGAVWYYNPNTSRCVSLNQSGCQKSVYEFQSWLDCMDACSSQRCHRLRRQHFIRKTAKAFLPECDDNGDFDPLQCHQNAGQCWCVDVKTGQEISGTKRSISDGVPHCKGCNYHLSQALAHYQRKMTPIQFLPKCAADGLYETVQCADDSDDCWCVDEVSGKEIDGTRSSTRPLSCELKKKVKPENVQVKVQNSSLYLKWEMPNNVTAKKYYVYFTQKPEEPINKWYVVVVYSPKDKKEFKLMNIALPEAKYAVKVKPVLDNESGVASEVTFAEPNIGRLSKPVNFRVDKVTPDSATLLWDRPGDWEGRNVKVTFHVRNLNTGDETDIEPTDHASRQFLALEPGTSYLVSMAIHGSNGESAFSEPIAVRTDDVLAHPMTSSPRTDVVLKLSTMPSVRISEMPEIIEYSEPQDFHLLWKTTDQPSISSGGLLDPQSASADSTKEKPLPLIPVYDGDNEIRPPTNEETLVKFPGTSEGSVHSIERPPFPKYSVDQNVFQPAHRISDDTASTAVSPYDVDTRSGDVSSPADKRPHVPALKSPELDSPVEYTTSTMGTLYRSTATFPSGKYEQIAHRSPPGPVQFRLSRKPGRTGFYVFWKQQKGPNLPKEYILYVADGRHSSLPATAAKTIVPASVHGYSVDATKPTRYTVWMQARNRFGDGPLSKPKLWFPSKPVTSHAPVPNWAPILISADAIGPEAIALKWIVPRGRTMPDADLTIVYSDNPKIPVDQWPSQVVPRGAKDRALLGVPDAAQLYKVCLQFDAPRGKGRPSNCLTTKPFTETKAIREDNYDIVSSMIVTAAPTMTMTRNEGDNPKDRMKLIRGSISKGDKRKTWVPRLLSAQPTAPNLIAVQWEPPSKQQSVDSDLLIHYGTDELRRVDKWPYVIVQSKESGHEIVQVPPSVQPYTFCARLRDSEGVGQTSNCVRAALGLTTILSTSTVTSTARPDHRQYMTLSPPAAPKITSVKRTSPSSLTVTWDTADDRSPEDNDIMIYYTDDPSKPITYWHSVASAEERRSKTFKIPNKNKAYTVCARSRNQYGLGELSNCETTKTSAESGSNQVSRQSTSHRGDNNENGSESSPSVGARSLKSNPSDFGGLPKSQATIYTYNPWLYTVTPRLYKVNSEMDRTLSMSARDVKEIPVKDYSRPSVKLPHFSSSKSTQSKTDPKRQPSSSRDNAELYLTANKAPLLMEHRPRGTGRENTERDAVIQGEPYWSTRTSEQHPNDRISEKIDPEWMDENQAIGETEQHSFNVIRENIGSYATDGGQSDGPKIFKNAKHGPTGDVIYGKIDNNRRRIDKDSIGRGNVQQKRPHGKSERYTIGKGQSSTASAVADNQQNGNGRRMNNNEQPTLRKPSERQSDNNNGKTVAPTITATVNCDFAQFTKSIPEHSVTTVSYCNCTCGAQTTQTRKVVCFYEDALEMRDDFPSGRLSHFTAAAVRGTPVPPGSEMACNCLRPEQGEQCPDGYLIKNGVCYDIDECAYRNGGCSKGCVNTAGSFYCACPYGMVRDPENPFQCATTDSFLAKVSKLFTVYVWDKIKGNTLTLESLIGSKQSNAAAKS